MRRLVMLAIPAVLALGACSSDDDDEPGTTAPGPTASEDTTPDGTESGLTLPDFTVPSIPDITISGEVEATARDALSGLGLDEAQIDCVIDRNRDVSQLSELNIMSELDACDIEISDLQPGG